MIPLATKTKKMHVFFCRSSFFLLCTVFIAGSSAAPLCAQQTPQTTTLEIAAPKKKKARVLKKEVEKEPLVKPDGILTKAYQSKAPWQLVSPFAPASYGNGEEMVSQDENELGKANGLIIFGIEW